MIDDRSAVAIGGPSVPQPRTWLHVPAGVSGDHITSVVVSVAVLMVSGVPEQVVPSTTPWIFSVSGRSLRPGMMSSTLKLTDAADGVVPAGMSTPGKLIMT